MRYEAFPRLFLGAFIALALGLLVLDFIATLALEVNLSFHLDRIVQWMIWVTAGVGLAVGWFSAHGLRPNTSRAGDQSGVSQESFPELEESED